MSDKYNISLKDYFAATALQGILSNAEMVKPAFEAATEQFGLGTDKSNKAIYKLLSGMAYGYADAMLEERSKNEA